MTLMPLGNKFTFKFIDKVVVRTDLDKRRTQFEETTEGGFVISSYDEGAKMPRWVTVINVGPEIPSTDFESGDVVLVDALKWSEALEFDNDTIWYSDLTQVLAVEESQI